MNAVKDIVPTQNNLAVEYEWCYPCNQLHNQATCSNGVINQALMVQNAASTQLEVARHATEQQYDSNLIDIVFVNWQREEFCGLNSDTPIATYTRARKRALELEQAANKGKEPAINEAPFSQAHVSQSNRLFPTKE